MGFISTQLLACGCLSGVEPVVTCCRTTSSWRTYVARRGAVRTTQTQRTLGATKAHTRCRPKYALDRVSGAHSAGPHVARGEDAGGSRWAVQQRS